MCTIGGGIPGTATVESYLVSNGDSVSLGAILPTGVGNYVQSECMIGRKVWYTDNNGDIKYFDMETETGTDVEAHIRTVTRPWVCTDGVDRMFFPGNQNTGDCRACLWCSPWHQSDSLATSPTYILALLYTVPCTVQWLFDLLSHMVVTCAPLALQDDMYSQSIFDHQRAAPVLQRIFDPKHHHTQTMEHMMPVNIDCYLSNAQDAQVVTMLD